MSTTVYVFTRTQGNKGTWSRYTFGFDITEFAPLDDDLYIRHGDLVSRVQKDPIGNTGTDEYNSLTETPPAEIRWSYLDFGTPGQSKMLESVDVVSAGAACTISVGYNQNNFFQVTEPVTIPASDTMDQTPIPLPVTGPSFSFIVLYDVPGVARFKFHSLVVNVHDTQAPA